MAPNEDFHERTHDQITTDLKTLQGLTLQVLERLTRVETKAAMFSALAGAVSGLAVSLFSVFFHR